MADKSLLAQFLIGPLPIAWTGQRHALAGAVENNLVAVLIGLLFLLPWMMQKLVFYTQNLIVNLPQYAR